MSYSEMNGMNTKPQITPEYMRALEARLTPAQKQRAFALAQSNGWKPTDTPPAWVWQQLFIQAMTEDHASETYAPTRPTP
jgi:hypothetical protein